MIEFEWDPQKAASNLEKHGVSFDEGASAFRDLLSLTIPDLTIPKANIGTCSWGTVPLGG